MSSRPAKALKRAADRRPRLYPRYRCEFPVALSLFSGEGHQELKAHGRDLSEGGIGVVVAAEIPPGEVASLVFSLPPSPEPWNVRAILRYRRGYHYGFEFLALSEARSKTLAAHLLQLERTDF